MFEFLILAILFITIGSFSSLVIYRLPIMEAGSSDINLFNPRSHCPKCKQTLPVKSLVPVMSFIIYRGKCSLCGLKIPYSYLYNELVHLTIGSIFFYYLGFTLIFIFSYLIFSLLYVLLVLDFKYLYLPISLNIIFVITGMVANIFFELYLSNQYSNIIYESSINSSILGFSLGFSSLWFINYIYKLLKKKDGIGGGDFILFGGIGAVLGPIALPLVMLIGSLFSILIYVIFITRNATSNEIPLGAGLICGFFIYVILKFYELNVFYIVL